MKLLLVIVSMIAVYTVDCRDLTGGPEDQDSVDNTPNYTDELKDHDYSEESQLKEEKGHNKRELRRSRCKARNACVVMGGFCVTNATLCSGRLVAEGCKGNNCQCCVPGTLELKIQSLEMELQSMKLNLTVSNDDLKMEVQLLNSNNTKANSDLKMELHSMEMNMTNSNTNMEQKLDSVKDAISNQASDINSLKAANSNQDSKLNSMNSVISNQNTKLNSIQDVQDCFLVGSQCFRLYMDTTRTWTSARSKCLSEGLILAEPTDSNAVALRRYVVQKFGDAQAWVGARGDGTKLVWEKRRTSMLKDNSLLQGGYGSSSSMSTSHCLELDVLQSQYDSYYSKPYDITGCTTSHFTLCEVVKGIVD